MKRLTLTAFGILFVLVLFFSGCRQNLTSSSSEEPIDRYDLVTRHNPVMNEADPLSAVTVGNGDFAYTADITGMQTLGDFYYQNGIPLETRTTWAWHSFPNTENLSMRDAMEEIDFHGRKILYATLQHSPAGDFFRKNPHPVPMGQIGLAGENNRAINPADIQEIHQELNLWTGLVNSEYKIDSQLVEVKTVSHPELSLVAFKIRSSLLKEGKLNPVFRFPYSYDFSMKNKPDYDWSHPDCHETKVIKQDSNTIILERSIDTSSYIVKIQWEGNGEWIRNSRHNFTLDCTGSDSLLLVCEFLPVQENKEYMPTFEDTRVGSGRSWSNYWTAGGVVDLSGSTDPRADELERRIVLSQYLMKVNYSGSFPPQESGMTHISWYGKHNSEVYWYHSAQFYQWNHTDLLEKGLQWYKRILPVAMDDAKNKGFEGARWPKMSGINGRLSPGEINPFIIWNHPNPIYLSELVYRANPDIQTLENYRDIVFESARFLASYAYFDPETERYILGPPIKPANESYEENTTINPTFELTQWYYGLKVAQDWRERLGMQRDSLWDDILEKLARPTIQDGKYVELESEPDMYNRDGHFSSNMLMTLGYLPKTPMIDKELMRNTFRAIVERNGINSFVSWTQGKGAMAAARLGEVETAVDIVCNDVPKARFSKTGYVQRPKEGIGNPAYLPVNGAFLEAIGLMAAGWDGAPDVNAPGFPKDGTWRVRVENLQKLP